MDDPEQVAGAPLKGAILIAGPTASGKSALAIDIARRMGGVVVNADSMQVYDVLRILTARPTDDELSRAPHRLYGHVDPRSPYSTGAWLRDVETLIGKGEFNDRPAIFAGGTGLYFKALIEGISKMPPVPEEVREHWRARLTVDGPQTLHEILARQDPAAAATLLPTDGQRIVRALEVFSASGRSIREWQAERGQPLVDASAARMMVIDPDRSDLARRIERRFDLMIEAGAIEEARAFAGLKVLPSMPAAKAIGLRELLDADAGRMGLDEAVERAKAATRQYAKRQMTWFRNQLDEGWERIR